MVNADNKTYRKDVRVYKLGGAEELTTSADSTIIFNGNKFDTSAGKTFTLDSSGEVVGLENAPGNELLSANVAENFVAMNLSTTDGLEEVFGDFSEGLTVNEFCVTGTNDTSIFIGEETMIGVELSRNVVKVVESSDANEIAVSGGGELTIGDNTFNTSDDFIGVATEYSIESFIGTISGKLGRGHGDD